MFSLFALRFASSLAKRFSSFLAFWFAFSFAKRFASSLAKRLASFLAFWFAFSFAKRLSSSFTKRFASFFSFWSLFIFKFCALLITLDFIVLKFSPLFTLCKNGCLFSFFIFLELLTILLKSLFCWFLSCCLACCWIISVSLRTPSVFKFCAFLIALFFTTLKFSPLLNLCRNAFLVALLKFLELFIIFSKSCFCCLRWPSWNSFSAIIFSSSSLFLRFFDRLRAICIASSFKVLKLLPDLRRFIKTRLSSFVKFLELLRIFCKNFIWFISRNVIFPCSLSFFIFLNSSSTFFLTLLKFLVCSKFLKNLAFMELFKFLELFSKTLSSCNFKS